MARIRSIKPEFAADSKVKRLSRDARLTFLLLLPESDDEGRLVGTTKRLVGLLYADDEDVTARKFEKWITELVTERMITRYVVDGTLYLHIRQFTKHQNPQHPKASSLPPPPPDKPPSGQRHEDGENGSRKPPEAVSPELSVVELSGDEREKNPPTPHAAPSTALAIPEDHVPQAARSGDTRTIFLTWCEATGRDPNRTKLDAKRTRFITKALGGYPVDDVLAAVQGWANLAHNRGDNDRHTVYNDLSLLLRDPEHIERYRDAWQKPAPLVGLSSRYDALRVLSGEGA